jgi:starch synthase
MTLSVLHIASEASPFVKTGGLADVCAALPRALARAGVRTSLVIPRYRAIDPRKHSLARRLLPLRVPLGDRTEEVILHEGRLPGGHVDVTLVDHPLFDREGIYGEGGHDYPDNARRFALLGRAALEIAHRADRWPDVVHGHDWQGALGIFYARRGAVPGRPVPATVLTIHNLAFQGLAPRAVVEELGLGWDIFTPEVGEFFGQLNLLKLGIAFADRLTTVSPRYAREICTSEQGAGLDGFLRERRSRLAGILNGIDTEIWDPERDPLLPVRYDGTDRLGKAACKAALQREVGLPVRASVPVFGQVSRLTEQKGYTLINECAEELAKLDAQVVFLGNGERRFEDMLSGLARRHPARIAFRGEYDEKLAHRIMAGADFYLMPSLFEPCGLNQMYAQRYGTVPIVRATGGLDDTVIDYDEATRTGTGFKFAEPTAAALVSAVKRAVILYRQRDAMNALLTQIMRLDHGWNVSARRTIELYERSITERRAA